MNPGLAAYREASYATLARECLSHRVNRFLHAHLCLVVVAGIGAVTITPKDEAGGAAWFLMQAVLYLTSLSSLLLGLSSAQAEIDERPFIATLPCGMGPWFTGKAVGLAAIAGGSTLLMVIPWLLNGGVAWLPVTFAAASGAFSVVLTLGGLAIGLWVHDPIRGLILTMAVWFVMLFGVDVALAGIAGSPWIQSHPAVWVVPLMLNPFDALRVMVLLRIEGAAYNTMGAGTVATWWITHSAEWLFICMAGWSLALIAASSFGLRRR